MTDHEPMPVEKYEGPITESPEFQMALAAETAKAMAEVRDNLMAEVKALMGHSNGGGDASVLAREIAMSMAQMADQGTGRRRDPPEVIRAREDAQVEMLSLLKAARDLPASKRPKYRLLAAGWFKDRLVQPFQFDIKSRDSYPTEIVYMAIPGLHMKPLNEAAKAIHSAYMRSISNNDNTEVPLINKAVWITDNGVVIAGGGTVTAKAHGRVIDPMDDAWNPDAPDVGSPEDDPDFGIVNQNDPRAKSINVLGTIAEPAKRTTAVDRAAKAMQHS